ncbi:hypothetical protein LIN78_04525 [Leeia sp. TBRC 13508]|uniref:Uncharacterized protein n=1 Tax=Leeia speluncae TaxID=2884804 RepID=A0ABS8D3P9_9NEIS|nr:hypothetical protein [Leeia speluncae]MCB6182814.1 hypothetical protein [Leeia speluncae]
MKKSAFLLAAMLLTMGLMAQADDMCGDKSYYSAVIGQCQGYAGGYWLPGTQRSSTPTQHTPRDYFGAIAADVVTGQASYSSNNYTSAAAAKSAAVQ